MSTGNGGPSFVPRLIRRLSIPIAIIWLALAASSNALIPPLEEIGRIHNVAQSAKDAPSLIAAKRVGTTFGEYDTDSLVTLVIEGDQPLGDAAHRFGDALVERMQADTAHVQHVQYFWGDPLTAAGSQSNDGKAALIQVYLDGDAGSSQANESVASVREIVADTPSPPGVKAYVSGPAALVADEFAVGEGGHLKVTGLTFGVIALMLLIVYRSITTTLLTLLAVAIQVAAARGLVAFLGHVGVIPLSTYATNLLTLLAIAAATDYAIFLLGRYQEARQAGEDRQAAYYTMYRSTAHVIIGSGLTVAAAVFCLRFTRTPYFQSLGIPAGLGVLVTLVASLTLTPAVITMGSHIGLFDPKRAMRTRGWRRIGTAIVRWPGPVLVTSIAVALIGLLALPGYKTSYDARHYMPDWAPAKVGYAAAERHFSAARLNPEVLMVESDKDLRTPANMIVLEKIAKEVFRTPGVAMVQSITRPLGTPLDHSSLGFQMSAQSSAQIQNLPFQQSQAQDLLDQISEISTSIDLLKRQYVAQQQLSDATDEQSRVFHETVDTMNELRDKIANVDDFFRPIRNYFYWEPHCYDIPVCWTFRSLFDALDGIDRLTTQFDGITAAIDKLTAVQPEILALIPEQIASQERNKALVEKNYATQSGLLEQSAEALKNADAMGQAFDEAKDDSTFYLPPEVFDNSEFKRGMKLFLSPDGHAARMIITHDTDPATTKGISHIDPIRQSAQEALKGTPLAGSSIYISGTASAYKDARDMAKYDLMMVIIAAVSLILLIMMFVTRSVVAAMVIVGTVVLSLGASFGLSVLIWQHLLGIQLYWIVLALAIIILLAVGSDYNLLVISRFKEEIGAGLNTGLIRTMAGTGSVVTAAGLVFAFTMCGFVVGDLMVLAQIGTTIGVGLIFDTLIVRSFMTPSIAALLGRWFWWPLKVRPRPASIMLRPYGTRPSVRKLLGSDG
ncbi:MMPL family transporter [Mycolicibacterium sp.]|uniref:MMPL/RND family transporter n=1 Tax=Mycolicibacterium sp. TaxID=2320850 RepID=UPI0025F8FD72|nr:MMPL family transporter [Mycolicibacterium sp.]MCB9409596.1 MMPL family transporter [Mycolicibacterium sp.]